MEFRERRSIYMQIADWICENILRGTWKEQDRIPSIREMAMDTQVNPNTVLRTYTTLQENGIIHNQRGLGYFVSPGATEKTRSMMREQFIRNELPDLFRKLDLLGISLKDLEALRERAAAQGGAR